jgi:hypothetical protein
MKLSILAGSTSQSINVFIQNSTSTTGAGLTGLVFNTGSLTAYYSHAGANATATAITLATLATVTTAWSSGGFKELHATNMPGWYRLDLPNAVLATAKGRSVALHLQGAANMAPCPVEIELTGVDNQDSVRAGMTALPNAVPGAAGGVFIAGTNAATTITTALTTTFTGNVTGSVGSVTGAVGSVTGAVGSVTAAVTLPTIPTDWISSAGVSAGAVTKIQTGLATPTNITAGTITTVTTLTNLPAITTDWLTGTGVAASAVTKIQAGLATPTNITAATGITLAAATHTGAVIPTVTTVTTATNLTNAPTAGDFTATMKTSIGTAVAASAVASVTGNVGGNVTGSVGSVVATVLKKNTALAKLEFMMTDSTNHVPATGKTVTCTRSIDGGAFAAGTLANVTEVAFGMYYVDFATGDLNGNVITLRATATGCDDTFVTLTTSP